MPFAGAFLMGFSPRVQAAAENVKKTFTA